jgi:hypothetical protein
VTCAHGDYSDFADYRLDPCSDCIGLANEGWQAEGTAEYGFVFIRRRGEQRLLSLTERDPNEATPQAFPKVVDLKLPTSRSAGHRHMVQLQVRRGPCVMRDPVCSMSQQRCRGEQKV